ncbi:DNA-binding protein [Enterobacter sp. Cy-643]|uniref:DNA-binding protein n=1 Tax=Enterobacter sp. Cy-643 TaxID=2608346 RepID=UPI00141D9571|nr:DNA-binding protein [Enterobacter sp. Cy-643]NIF31822.1 DNA-binding protein [Enterobacter sp. Cy-643]
MNERIDYQIEKYSFTEIEEPPRLSRQWEEVRQEFQREPQDAEQRLRLALLNVDYVTSFELPFRLLLLRAPQLIDKLRGELQLSQKTVVINDNKRGEVYSIKDDLSAVPDAFRYRFSNRIRRIDPGGTPATAWQQIALQVRNPRDRLKVALEGGLQVNALDGLFWFGLQRIAADISVLRQSGMPIITTERTVFDSLTGTTRSIPAYRLSPEIAQ